MSQSNYVWLIVDVETEAPRWAFTTKYLALKFAKDVSRKALYSAIRMYCGRSPRLSTTEVIQLGTLADWIASEEGV